MVEGEAEELADTLPGSDDKGEGEEEELPPILTLLEGGGERESINEIIGLGEEY